MNRPFLGRGWKFPPTFDRVLPGVQMLEEEADIASSLEVLLTTAQGERVMLPQYGCNLEELLFEGLDTRMKTLMADKVESAILYHEPRIELESVRLDDSLGTRGASGLLTELLGFLMTGGHTSTTATATQTMVMQPVSQRRG
jgi:hypothetical protein